MTTRILFLLSLLCFSLGSSADEIRPGYLQLSENSPGVFSVLWKVPAKGSTVPALEVGLPAGCKDVAREQAQLIDGAYIQRWMTACEKQGLVGRKITVSGLENTSMDVLLHLEYLDGRSHSTQLTPVQPAYRVPAVSSSIAIAATYTWLGITHILEGVDHLLFVFALLLIVREWRRLIATITAFTVAHSITLAAATLGLVHVPQQPVEAVIALSILFLAMEWMHGRQGHPGAAARWPWLIAFIFGLLHGFGFAGALAEVGLPQHAIPLALVFFNVGVETGQLLFITLVLSAGWLLHRLQRPRWVAYAEMAAIYAIGGLSSFWLIERVSAY